MDNYIPMQCQSCGDKLEPTAYPNRFRCPSCGNEYLIDQDAGGLVRANQPPPEAKPAAHSQDMVGYIPVAEAYITALKFFNSGSQAKPTKERQYETRFLSNTEYIYWELNLNHPETDKTVEFAVFVAWNYPDGKKYSQTMKIKIEPGWTWSRWWDRTAERYTQGKNWMTGDYRLDFFVDGKPITSSTFTIYELDV